MRKHNTNSQDGSFEQKLIDVEDIRDATAYEFSHHEHPHVRMWTIVSRVLRRKRFFLALTMLVLAGLTIYLKHLGVLSPKILMDIAKENPFIAPAIFSLAYALMVTFLLPTLPLNLAAGFLWGGFRGTILSVGAAAMGAVLAFVVTRYLARPFVQKRFNSRTWRWLRIEIKKNEWQVMAFTRLNPIFPFGPLNYFFGLTSVSLVNFIWTTIVFIIPPSAMFSFIGASVGGFVMDQGAETMVKNVLAVSVAITVLVAFRIVMKKVGAAKKSTHTRLEMRSK